MNYKPVIIAVSNQNLLIENFISELKSNIEKDESKILFSTYYFDDMDMSEIVTNAKTASMFHKNKLIHVKNIDPKKTAPLLDELTDNPQDFCKIVLSTDKISKEFSKFKDKISVVSLDSQSSFDSMVKEEAGKLNLEPSSKAIKTIISLLGENLNVIRNELEKIAASNIGQKISEKNIKEFIEKQNYDNSYSLLSAVAARDIKASIKILCELEKKKEDPIGILSLLSWRVRQIFKALELARDKKSNEEIAKSLKTSKGAVYYILKDCRNFKISELKKILESISEIDLKLKSSVEDNYILLGKLVTKICKN